MQRGYPAINWLNIEPPYDGTRLNYDYFYKSELLPFQNGITSFSAVNAWWMCECATLAYATPEFVAKVLPESHPLAVSAFFSGASTQCYVFSDTTKVIVAFRGTESDIWGGPNTWKDISPDLMADFTAVPIPIGLVFDGALVHSGFDVALHEVWKSLCKFLTADFLRNRTLYFTGHSLGAALATLAAYKWERACGPLHTFGSPRVGNAAFVRHLDSNRQHYRLVNFKDGVTRVPPGPIYQHSGTRMYIDENHVVGGSREDGAFDWSELNPKRLFEPPEWLMCHVPILYSIALWNGCRPN